MLHIIDIDGCISDDRWRRYLLPEHNDSTIDGDYDLYHGMALHDGVMNRDAVLAGASELLFITSRPERHRDATISWLIKYFVPCGMRWSLLMRPGGDLRHSDKLKPALLRKHELNSDFNATRAVAFEDREDVLAAYDKFGIPELYLADGNGVRRWQMSQRGNNAANILASAAETFANRNAVYTNNYQQVAPIVKQLWPDGVPPELTAQDQWHLFELIVVKLTRFANSALTHEDSIHDIMVYAAMIQSIIQEQET